jgi:capsular polysaccharide biosynthesis protein
VANNTEGAANPDIIMRSANVIKGYSQIATSIKVLDRAASLLNREGITGHDIKNIITVEYDSDSPVLTISARSDKPNLSISIANAVAESFVLEIRAITAQKNAAILDVSSEAEMVTDGKRLKWLSRLAGFLAGVFAMICFFAVRDIFSTRIYSSADASLDGQLEIIGTVPILGAEKHKAISDE